MKSNGNINKTRKVKILLIIFLWACTSNNNSEPTDAEKLKIAEDFYSQRDIKLIYPDSTRLAQSAKHLEISGKISEYMYYNLKYPAKGLEKKMNYTILAIYEVAEDSTIYVWCHRGKFNDIFETEAKRVLYEAVKNAFDTSMIGTSSTYPIIFDYNKYMEKVGKK